MERGRHVPFLCFFFYFFLERIFSDLTPVSHFPSNLKFLFDLEKKLFEELV